MDFRSLGSALGHPFSDARLLQTALTHRSFGAAHNERLEFLGDGVLNFVIAAYLYERYPDMPEGDLSRARANLVRQETLQKLAQQLQLGEQLRLGEGELRSGGQRRPSILADALEAVFGAVYLDGGFAAAERVIRQLYAPLIGLMLSERSLKDAKTRLQEWLQGRGHPLPKYSLIETTGAAHAQVFRVSCEVRGLDAPCVGEGTSRRHAEQDAAQRALRELEQ